MEKQKFQNIIKDKIIMCLSIEGCAYLISEILQVIRCIVNQL